MLMLEDALSGPMARSDGNSAMCSRTAATVALVCKAVRRVGVLRGCEHHFAARV
jgi:hypothetical protein